MIDEEILQKVLSATIERLGKQAIIYETEIANLNAQIMILTAQQKSEEK
jgi:hypothetical protein